MWGFLPIPSKRVHRFGGIGKNPLYMSQQFWLYSPAVARTIEPHHEAMQSR